MAKSTLKDFIRLFMIDLILISLAQNSLSSAEVIQKAPPIYGTCTLAKSGGEFQTAICLLKQLCPTCDFGTLNKNSIKVVVRNKEVDSLYITTDRQQSYGLISATGKVEATVRFGSIIDLCLYESGQTLVSGHEFEDKSCVRVSWMGKPRSFVYPPKFEELFKGAKFKLKYVIDDMSEREKLTINTLALTAPLSLCGLNLPQGTEISFPFESGVTEINAIPPSSFTMPNGKRIGPREKLVLYEDSKCVGEVQKKADDET